MDNTQNIPAAPIQSAPVMESPHNGGSKLGIIIGALVVVVIVAFIAYKVLANPFAGKTAQDILRETFAREVKSLSSKDDVKQENISVDSIVDIKATMPALSGNASATYNLKMPLNILVEQIEKDQINFSLKASSIDFGSILSSVGFPGNDPQKFSGEIRAFSKEKKIFSQVTEMPTIVGMFAPNVVKLATWYSANFESKGFSSDFKLDPTASLSLTDEQKTQLVDLANKYFIETSRADISMKTVGKAREITYKMKVEDFQVSLTDFGKEANKVVGKKVFPEYSTSDEKNVKGTLELVFVIEPDFTASKATVDAKISDKDIAVSMKGSFSENRLLIDYVAPIEGDEVKMKIDLLVEPIDGSELSNASGFIEVISKAFTMRVDIKTDTKTYTGTKITVPENAISLD